MIGPTLSLLILLVSLPNFLYAASVEKVLADGQKIIVILTAAEALKVKPGSVVTLSSKKYTLQLSGTVTKLSNKKASIDLEVPVLPLAKGTRLDIKTKSAATDPTLAGATAESSLEPTSTALAANAKTGGFYPYAPSFLSLHTLYIDRPTTHLFVSPASLFKTQQILVNAAFRYGQRKGEEKSSGASSSKTTETADLQDIELLAAIPIKANQFNLGVRFVQNSISTTFKTETSKIKVKFETSIFGLLASAVVMQNLSLGVQYDLTSLSIKTDGGKVKTSYNVFRPGLTLFNPGWELELFYSPPISISDSNEFASEPGAVILNGRFGPPQRIIAVQIQRLNFSTLSEDFSDILAFRLGMESARPTLTTFGGYVHYKQQVYDDEDAITESALQRLGLEAFFQQEVSAKAHAGVFLNYMQTPKEEVTEGSGTSEVKESYQLSGFEIAISGTMLL